MKRNRVLLSVAIGLLVSLVTSAWADESDDLAAAITSGKAGVNVRARYEHVDQDGIAETADALTARLRLNYRTGQWMGWSGFAEYDHVFHVLTLITRQARQRRCASAGNVSCSIISGLSVAWAGVKMNKPMMP
jgi:hypothetical protein